MRFHCVATKHNALLDTALGHIDEDKCDMAVFTAASQSKFGLRPHQAIYEFSASLLRLQSVCSVLMRFHCIANEYYGPLEAAHAHMDDDRHDMVE